MGRSRTHEAHPGDTRPGAPRGHWHTGGGTPGASGDTGHVLGSAVQGPARSPQREGGKGPWGRGRLWMKSAGGSEGSPAPGQAEQRKGEAAPPLAGGEEGAKEVPGALLGAQPGAAGLQLGTQAKGRKPHQWHMHHRCLSRPHSPYAGAQQTREGEDRERDRRGGCLQAQHPGDRASLTPLEQGPGGRRIFLAENQVPHQRESGEKPPGQSRPLHAWGLGTWGTLHALGHTSGITRGETGEPWPTQGR